MERRIRPFALLALIAILLTPITAVKSASIQQGDPAQEYAQALIQRLTPGERVGQLFLITFSGPEAGPSTTNRIYDLITKYHIGGVILKESNDNFLAHDQTLPIALSLTRQLQTIEYNSSLQKQTDPISGETYTPAFIPLFIGIAQEGDSFPFDQITSSDITQLPSQMAIGATWQPELAQQVGFVLGSELSSLGFNLLLGPSLDVLGSTSPEGGGDLGVRTFGGNPFWVGEMGRSFIRGVHQGSVGEMAIVAKHFPGYGSSDRLPEDEVATILKSLEQLREEELFPFYAVTGNSPSPDATADALLIAHMRNEGLQGNIRPTTKPVSLDQGALNQLMNLDEFKSWRDGGGMLVSDDLGSQAIRRFYESTGQSYIGRYVARDAFLAGNDLLYLGNIISENDPDLYTSVVRTLEFFTQKYQEDTAFAERVDRSLLRILTLKANLYENSFILSRARASATVPGFVGSSNQVSFEIVQRAASLLSPSIEELSSTVPDPPGRNDRIVFITDQRFSKQCNACPLQPLISVNALEQVVVRLYSPQAGGQVLPGNLASYTYDQLQEMLDVGTGIVQIENDIRLANWIVFLALDENPSYPNSYALRNFLAGRPDLIQNKKIVVFAMNTPYFLDATEVSKLSAFYALYTKLPRAIEVAARILFYEIRPSGYLPITVTGVGYNLDEAIQPDPDQTIPLLLDIPETITPTVTVTPGVPPGIKYKIGDQIPIRTGIILDHNGHEVPDNTSVIFVITQGNGGASTIDSKTVEGIARTIVRVETPGALSINVISGSAENSNTLTFDIPLAEGEVFPPTVTPIPTATPTLTPSSTLTATVEPTPLPTVIEYRTTLGQWFLATLIAIVLGGVAYWTTFLIGQMRWGVRGGFLTLLGGMGAYLYLALDMPGSQALIQRAGVWGVILVIILGCVAGWSSTWAWRSLQQRYAR
jgi:beta-N-acetylhexosaminidase